MELVHQPREVDDQQDFVGEVIFQSVDQIVVDGLKSIDSNELQSETLIQIYKSLSEL